MLFFIWRCNQKPLGISTGMHIPKTFSVLHLFFRWCGNQNHSMEFQFWLVFQFQLSSSLVFLLVSLNESSFSFLVVQFQSSFNCGWFCSIQFQFIFYFRWSLVSIALSSTLIQVQSNETLYPKPIPNDGVKNLLFKLFSLLRLLSRSFF